MTPVSLPSTRASWSTPATCPELWQCMWGCARCRPSPPEASFGRGIFCGSIVFNAELLHGGHQPGGCAVHPAEIMACHGETAAHKPQPPVLQHQRIVLRGGRRHYEFRALCDMVDRANLPHPAIILADRGSVYASLASSVWNCCWNSLKLILFAGSCSPPPFITANILPLLLSYKQDYILGLVDLS